MTVLRGVLNDLLIELGVEGRRPPLAAELFDPALAWINGREGALVRAMYERGYRSEAERLIPVLLGECGSDAMLIAAVALTLDLSDDEMMRLQWAAIEDSSARLERRLELESVSAGPARTLPSS